MTEPHDQDMTPPDGQALTDEPIPDDGDPGADGTAGARAREWLAQLESMISEIATQAAPVARQVGAKAAELAGVAATKAGPFAQKAAEKTTDVGQRFAERAQSVAAELRADQSKAGEADAAGAPADEPAADTGADTEETPQA